MKRKEGEEEEDEEEGEEDEGEEEGEDLEAGEEVRCEMLGNRPKRLAPTARLPSFRTNCVPMQPSMPLLLWMLLLMLLLLRLQLLLLL